ncbi:MAG: SOS response-associated peptidase family protein [Ignavibacteriae bacterium]|nr:SOS response-associated peptidase family protein [Ignavibacteriota bacterium]
MCSRFENKETGESIFKKLKKVTSGKITLEETGGLKTTGIAPTNKIITVIPQKNGEMGITTSKWGIKFDVKAPVIFNSRIETIREKPYWRRTFGSGRCLIPATAFYEWTEKEGRKMPQRISLDENSLFFIPSIYIHKKEKISGSRKDADESMQPDVSGTAASTGIVIMASMITTMPNSFMKSQHNRMPVIMRLDECLKFLEVPPEAALEYCLPLDEEVKMSAEDAE